MQIQHVLLLLIASVLVACGGGAGDENHDSAATSTESDLIANLYSGEEAGAVYFHEVSQSGDAFRASILESMNMDWGDYKVGLVDVRYKNTNLPQFAFHVHRDGNRKMVVYNHGHGGLPQASELWAYDLLRRLMSAGFDILITSMPLSGVNKPNPNEQYWMVPWGSTQKSYIDAQTLATWPYTHAVYEAVRGSGHYAHFFVDQIVLMAGALRASGEPLWLKGFASIRAGFPAARYDQTYFVGLSGGGWSGLIGCGILDFDKCILIAGFLPMYLRVQSLNSWGDSEQVSSSLYRDFSYENLMQAAEGRSGSVYYLYNKKDSCCFSDPQASIFQRDFDGSNIVLTDLDFHGYSASQIMDLLQQ